MLSGWCQFTKLSLAGPSEQPHYCVLQHLLCIWTYYTFHFVLWWVFYCILQSLLYFVLFRWLRTALLFCFFFNEYNFKQPPANDPTSVFCNVNFVLYSVNFSLGWMLCSQAPSEHPQSTLQSAVFCKDVLCYILVSILLYTSCYVAILLYTSCPLALFCLCLGMFCSESTWFWTYQVKFFSLQTIKDHSSQNYTFQLWVEKQNFLHQPCTILYKPSG